MNNKKNYSKGTRQNIIKIIHMNGIFPTKGLAIMKTPMTYIRKIKEMVDEGIVEEHRVKAGTESHRIITMKNYEKNRPLYQDEIGDGYYETYITYGQEAAKRCLYKKGGEPARIITNTETYMIMKEAGVKCDLLEKPSLYKNILLDDANAYYNSIEIKNYTDYHDKVKINKDAFGNAMKSVISSRITGLLISKGGVYPTYHIGKSLADWKKGSEYKIKLFIKNIISGKMENPRPCDTALVILTDYPSLSHFYSFFKNDHLA